MSSTMSELVTALEGAWADIQKHNPDVPNALVVVGPSGDKKTRKLGHWARRSWVGKDGERAHEVFISAERLERSAVEVFTTLIHEAAHALATAREIQDVTKGSQYHNGEYKKLAEEVGLNVEKHSSKGRGWAKTTLRQKTTVLYKDAIFALHAAMVGFRNPELEVVKGRDKAKAKLSSAKSQIRWLGKENPDELMAVVAEIATPEMIHAMAKAAGLTCPHCNQAI